MFRFFGAIILIFGMSIALCSAEEEDAEGAKKLSMDDVKGKFEDAFSAPVKGAEDFFKNAAAEAKEKIQSTGESMQEFAKQAQEKTASGIDAAKGLAFGFGDHMTNMRERFEENGAKMKEALQSAAEKSKDEFETAASKISEHAKKASESMFSLFNFKIGGDDE